MVFSTDTVAYTARADPTSYPEDDLLSLTFLGKKGIRNSNNESNFFYIS